MSWVERLKGSTQHHLSQHSFKLLLLDLLATQLSKGSAMMMMMKKKAFECSQYSAYWFVVIAYFPRIQLCSHEMPPSKFYSLYTCVLDDTRKYLLGRFLQSLMRNTIVREQEGKFMCSPSISTSHFHSFKSFSTGQLKFIFQNEDLMDPLWFLDSSLVVP